MLNIVNLQGRVTRDIELKYTQSGKKYCICTLAVSRDFGGENKETDFFDCMCWGDRAEWLAFNVHKGDKLTVVGRLETSKYEKDGQKHTMTKVVVEKYYVEWAKPKETEKPDIDVKVDPLDTFKQENKGSFTETSDEDLPF